MKIRIVQLALGVLVVVCLLLAVALHLWGGRPWVFSKYRDIDTSSGDVRTRTVRLGIQASERVEESPFSREVRRLQIRRPEARVWRSMNVSTRTDFTMGDYDGAVEDCNFLVQMFDVMKVSDEDRIDVLQKALSNLRAGELDATDELIWEVSNQLHQFLGLPPEEQRPRVFNEHRIIR